MKAHSTQDKPPDPVRHYLHGRDLIVSVVLGVGMILNIWNAYQMLMNQSPTPDWVLLCAAITLVSASPSVGHWTEQKRYILSVLAGITAMSQFVILIIAGGPMLTQQQLAAYFAIPLLVGSGVLWLAGKPNFRLTYRHTVMLILATTIIANAYISLLYFVWGLYTFTQISTNVLYVITTAMIVPTLTMVYFLSHKRQKGAIVAGAITVYPLLTGAVVTVLNLEIPGLSTFMGALLPILWNTILLVMVWNTPEPTT